MSLIFWPEFPYIRWAAPEEPAQTVEEATKYIQAANLRKVKRMARNIRNQQRGGFTWTKPKHQTIQTTSGETTEVRDENS